MPPAEGHHDIAEVGQLSQQRQTCGSDDRGYDFAADKGGHHPHQGRDAIQRRYFHQVSGEYFLQLQQHVVVVRVHGVVNCSYLVLFAGAERSKSDCWVFLDLESGRISPALDQPALSCRSLYACTQSFDVFFPDLCDQRLSQ